MAVPSSASAPDAFFDAAAPAALVLPPRAPAPAAKPVAPVPPALVTAAGRVGHAAMLAKLAAAPAPSGEFSFGVLGDAEPGRFAWERVFNPGKDAFVEQWRALQAKTDFVLQLGDFVSEGDAPHYEAHVALVDRELTKPLLRCVGNHDRSRPNGSADKRFWDAVFGARDYYFDRGGWRFVSLDSSDRGLTPAQLSWLAGVLAAPGPKVVFTHVPPAYLGGVKPLAALGPVEPWSKSPSIRLKQQSALEDFFDNYFDRGAAEFEKLAVAGNVKAVFMGHIHALWAGDRNGIRYVISGGGGSPLYPLPPGYPKRRFAHALRVTASGGALTTEVLPWKGSPFVLP